MVCPNVQPNFATHCESMCILLYLDVWPKVNVTDRQNMLATHQTGPVVPVKQVTVAQQTIDDRP